jgi:hypothetical protein
MRRVVLGVAQLNAQRQARHFTPHPHAEGTGAELVQGQPAGLGIHLLLPFRRTHQGARRRQPLPQQHQRCQHQTYRAEKDAEKPFHRYGLCPDVRGPQGSASGRPRRA